jgi:hypothetical protein
MLEHGAVVIWRRSIIFWTPAGMFAWAEVARIDQEMNLAKGTNHNGEPRLGQARWGLPQKG